MCYHLLSGLILLLLFPLHTDAVVCVGLGGQPVFFQRELLRRRACSGCFVGAVVGTVVGAVVGHVVGHAVLGDRLSVGQTVVLVYSDDGARIWCPDLSVLRSTIETYYMNERGSSRPIYTRTLLMSSDEVRHM